MRRYLPRSTIEKNVLLGRQRKNRNSGCSAFSFCGSELQSTKSTWMPNETLQMASTKRSLVNGQ